MNNQTNQEIINKLTKTVLIGLPAVGKSTLADELCHIVKEKTGIEIENVSSDLKLRAIRKDANHPVTIKFMQEHNIPESDFPLLIKTSEFVQKYGEQTFRDLESAVILDMLEQGEFEGKIPNLGGKAILHPKTAQAFKDRGYNIIYLKTDLKVIAKHIADDFEKMLDGATITRSPINTPLKADLKQKFPDIAEMSPTVYVQDRCQKMLHILKSANPLRDLKKAKLQRQKEKYRYLSRIKERNRKALEIISKRYVDSNSLYQEVSDMSIFLSGNLKNDVSLLCQTIGIEDLSINAKENDTYTNSIHSIISGINEVIPYTYNDKQYTYQQYFNPIIEQMLDKAPSSDHPKLIHMMGIPGSGKSTFYQNHKDWFNDFVLIGFDLVMESVPQYQEDRKTLGKMEAFKKWELPARIAGYELLRRAINERKNIFFDHGGTPICHRELLGNIRKMGYETTMYYINCEPQTAINRIANRERPFPAERMHGRIAAIRKQKQVMPSIVDNFIKINSK